MKITTDFTEEHGFYIPCRSVYSVVKNIESLD